MDITLDNNKRYTYADYLTWLDDERRELLDGYIRVITQGQSLTHAVTRNDVFMPLANYIINQGRKCQIFLAPFDVRLPKKPDEISDDKIYTVVQPDICIVCDESKLDERGCLGAPDMVVEILSLSSLKYDLNDKFNLYEAAGVKEYWVVAPKDKGVTVFILQDNEIYDNGTVYEEEVEIPVKTLPGLSLNTLEIFPDKT